MPSCPLARGSGAVLLVGRELVASSSELTSWIALFGLLYWSPGYSRPAYFLSQVADSGDIVHRPDYTPNHQRSQLGTLLCRIVGVSMTNGTRHDPCIPRHWAMRCPAWTLTRTSHNRVFSKIRPNIDVASISSVLHLVWPLAQSLSSMVVPTRSQNSSWHSLWDLQGTQAPQLRQSNNTLGGALCKDIQLLIMSDAVVYLSQEGYRSRCQTREAPLPPNISRPTDIYRGSKVTFDYQAPKHLYVA